ncbi:MAG: succinylglutamate desuccinylase/aspartoacylase family protein [Candidatus Bathyarchaeia archaeon]|nr:succinylglutamate desuccinylase/aspartoacylase family protein [Candidatus Bathyarchaeota archaeon]
MSEIHLGTVCAKPGEKVRGFLKVGETPYGTPIELPLIVINGIEAGKRLWVQSAIHPVEWTGTMALIRIINNLEPKKMKGTLIAIPTLNITGFGLLGRGSVYDPIDMNRVWPGKLDGSFTEQMVAILFEQITKVADYLIDFHCAGHPKTKWVLHFKGDTEAAKESRKFADAFGWEIVVESECPRLAGAVYTQAMKKGIPSIIIEAGQGMSFSGSGVTEEAVNWSYEGILNALKYLKIIEGTPKKPEWYVHCDDFCWSEAEPLPQVRTARGGIVWALKEPGDRVSKDEVIAVVYNVWGEIVEKVKSPVNGIILTINSRPAVNGFPVAQIGIIS